MSGGLLDHLTEASHIAAGIGCTFDEAMEIVKAANAEPEPIPPATIGNVVYGVDFRRR
jgi:hypothetical protein